MNTRRVLAIAKLVILFGTPLAFVVGLFSCGVYYGASHREGITRFERDWLGLDVEVPASAPKTPPNGGASEAPADTKSPPGGAAPAPAPDEGKAPAPDEPAPAPDARPPEPAPEPEPPAPEPPAPAVGEPDSDPAVPTPETRTDPLQGDLATRLQRPVTVSVKVVVDDALIAARPDWIDYVQRTVAAASQVYEKQFGITLELASVGRWNVVTDGLDAGQLLDDVRARPREGSDILVGFTNRPLDDRTAGKADTPSPESAYNGAYGVVYATPGHRTAHVRTLLHELGHVFGALDVTDPSDPAFAAHSFMSYAATRESEAPWIDADNRTRILERKDLPFVPEPEATR